MENVTTAENLDQKEKVFEEAYKDEFWAKKYDVTMDELKKIGNAGISSLIIQAGIKHKTFSLEA